jgi:uncharacterized coiled-coil DUF342 family protein
MRAITRLEKRFNMALAKLDAGADAGAGLKENAKLVKQIDKLETIKAESDKKIDTLNAEVTTLTKNSGNSLKEINELKQAQTVAQKETAELNASLEKTKTEGSAALKQVNDLEEKLKNTEATSSDNADVAELKASLKAAEAKSDELFKRVRRLRGSLRQVRTGLNENVLNADDVNTALEAELEALQVQREVDLTEVNSVLAKLKPLVEGK